MTSFEQGKGKTAGQAVLLQRQEGDIYDRNGKVLAESATVKHLFAILGIWRRTDSEVIAARLALALNMDQNEILKIITKKTKIPSYKNVFTNEQTEAVKKIKRFRC